jgi:hypothetical protein
LLEDTKMACLEDETHSLWDKLGVTDRTLVADFFITFSRFEYALKRSGYLRQDKANVNPDWDAFGTRDENKRSFDSDASADLRQAVEYLLKHPPQKQIRTGKDSFEYRTRPLRGQSGLHEAVLAIRRVRNNLFHGGKFHDGHVEDLARNTDLLRHSLMLLEHILKLDDRVQGFFWEV